MSKHVIQKVKERRVDLFILFVGLIVMFAGIIIGFSPYASISFNNVASQSAGDYAFFIMLAGAIISLVGIYPMLPKEEKERKTK